MADCVSRSALLGHHPVTVIPNVLDTALFCPQDRASCRAALGLPQDSQLVLFGAIQAGADPNKGFDLLVESLRYLATDMPAAGIECAVFGADAPPAGIELPVTTHWLGRVDTETALARVYAAADVMVVPSRVENLPQTATEAQACGCPVVAFRTAGLPDAVADRQTGWLARALEARDLAAGIRWVIEDAQRQTRLSQAARERALHLWGANTVLPRLMEQYALAVRDVRPSRSEPAPFEVPMTSTCRICAQPTRHVFDLHASRHGIDVPVYRCASCRAYWSDGGPVNYDYVDLSSYYLPRAMPSGRATSGSSHIWSADRDRKFHGYRRWHGLLTRGGNTPRLVSPGARAQQSVGPTRSAPRAGRGQRLSRR